MERTLFLELFQPFAQYRNPFTFYYAQTFPLPPKSTIIGMLQNATGRYYDPAFWALKLSVHGGFESSFENYQSLIMGRVTLRTLGGNVALMNRGRRLYGLGPKSQRYPVVQQELFNGRIYLFLRGDENIIMEISTALRRMPKVLSLGRSEDIIFIKNDLSIKPSESAEVKRDLWLTYPTYILSETKGGEKFPLKNQKYPVYSLPLKVQFENKVGENFVPVKSKAEISKKTERRTEFGKVIHTGYDYTIHLREGSKVNIETHKVTLSDGTDKIFKILTDYGWL
jgi:CRISPR-associated protein Cas5t